MPKKIRRLWCNEALRLAFDALDSGYKMSEVSMKYGIPRSSLREHYHGRRKSRKLGPKGVLTMVEEEELVKYLHKMVRVSCPLNIAELKLKVVEITQGRMTPFINLDLNRTKALCPTNVAQFYENLEGLYQEHQYDTSQVWNCDETRAQANKNGEAMVFARRGIRSVHTLVPNERQWLSILVAINSARTTMPNYYVFKGKRPNPDFISKCENGACMSMQDNGYMDGENFSKWITFLSTIMKQEGIYYLPRRFCFDFGWSQIHMN